MPRQPARASSGRYVSRLTGGTLAIIMAGGRGERLRDLTAHRCKPATPFGGKFRIIDFVLSNCVNSGIRQISILTQYKAQSLIQHVQHGWSYLRGEFSEFVEVVPAQQQLGPLWYRGTADAVHQNIELIVSHRPKHVLVLAGDHIYKMDYGPMIAYHVEKGADITVGVVEVPAQDSQHFGVLTATEWNRVTKFAEKPATPDSLPGRPDTILASMGIYVFNTRLLESLLAADAANESSAHDFGRDVLPVAIAGDRQVFAYPFQDVQTRAQSYWRDVGTIDAYYDANLELVHVRPELNIYDQDWPIWTYQVQQPPAKFVLVQDEFRGRLLHLVGPDGPVLIVDVELRAHLAQLEVGVLVGIDGADVAPVALRTRLHVLERISKHLAVAGDGYGQDVAAEIVGGGLVGSVRGEQALEQARVEHVDAHGGENGVGAARQRVGRRRLLRELRDPIPLGRGQHPVMLRVLRRHLDPPDGDVGALLHVVGDHRTVVHLVDMVPGEHQHVLGPVRDDQLDVLVHGVRRTPVPQRTQLLLRGNHLDELAEFTAQVAPAVLHVLDQRLRLVLRENGDLADPRVHAVRQHEVDDAELAAEGRRRLAAMRGEIPQPLPAPARHDDGERAARQAAHVASGGRACGLSGQVG